MKKINFIALLAVCIFSGMQAQNETHALRLSWQNPFGTARYAAQGGSIGALGGDVSALQANPAGLATYRSSEFSISPSFYWVNSESDFLGNRVADSRLRFNIGNMGYVAAKPSRRKRGFVGAAFGFSYNTLVNYNSTVTMMGQNQESSMMDDFTWHANQNPDDLDPFYEQVVMDADLFVYDSIAGVFRNDFEMGGYGQEQSRVVDHSGHVGEYAFSGAFNFSNILYAGATFGIQSVRFYEDIFHEEEDVSNSIDYLRRFDFREFNSTEGWGYTFRIGMIVRPIQALRLGASIQIPTFYYLNEEKYTDAVSDWDSWTGWESLTGISPLGRYQYRIKTPMRAGAQASLVIAKFATLSAAYEFVDYSAARLDSYEERFVDENNAIRRNYRDGHHLKTGMEIRLSALYLRGGFQYISSPYADSRNDANMMVYSGGMGVRTRWVFFDVSYSYGSQTQVYGLYNPMNGAPEGSYTSVNQMNPNNLIFTTGFRF